MAWILMVAYTNYRRDPRVRREAEALIEAGHQVTFLARRQAGEPDREAIAGVDVIKLTAMKEKCDSVAQYIADYVVFFLGVFAHCVRHPLRYDLIHVNNMPDFLVFASALPRLLGRPVVHDVHDLMPELYSEKFGSKPHRGLLMRALELQERWAGRFATAVLTVEERLRDILARRGIPRDKIHVLMNLPDDRIFAPREPSPKASDARFVMVYHGTLAHRLGLDLAIRAAAQLRSEIPCLEIRIIGAGEERTRLMALRDELGLQETVSFSPGFVPVERIPQMLIDADVGLIPLRINSGTDIMLPTKLLEYVAMGIPCIVPKTGTISRYFDDEMVRFFQAENVASLAAAMLELYRHPSRREALARAATERFACAHSWKVHKQVYLGLIERLLAPPLPRH